MPHIVLVRIAAVGLATCLFAFKIHAKEPYLCTLPPLPGNVGNVSALIACIHNANLFGRGTIDLGGAIYTLTSGSFVSVNNDGPNGLPVITGNITIKNGTVTTTSNTPTFVGTPFRILYVMGTLSLKEVILENGNDASGFGGGALYVMTDGIVGSLEKVTFNNNVSNGFGGAIFIFNATVNTINKSHFTQNSALVGGAIYVGGVVNNIKDTVFSNNTAMAGGGIYVDQISSVATVTDSVFLSNETELSGGAIYVNTNSFLGTINKSTFSFNIAHGGNGGALEVFGLVNVVSNSTFNDNESTVFSGGAISVEPLGATIVKMFNDTFNQNQAGMHGGAISIQCVSFVANSAGFIGGLYNSTISGNLAAIANGGGGIYNCGTINQMQSVIAAGNYNITELPANEDDVNNCNSGSGPVGVINNALFNLIGIDLNTPPTFTNGVNGNIVGTTSPPNPIDPKLGVLRHNGGPTKTMALLSSSPAIGAGRNPLGRHHDQRGEGFSREVHDKTDMGAYEVQRFEAFRRSRYLREPEHF